MKLRLLISSVILCTLFYHPVNAQDTDLDGIADSIDVDDDNDGILDVIECSDLGKIPLLNSDFEDIDIISSGLDQGPTDVVPTLGVWKGDASNIPNWESADAVNNHLEIWHNGHSVADDVGGIAYSGTQWAEINATTNDGLYQDITTTPGDLMYWSFAHRKRLGFAGSATEDEMRLLIGPPGGPLISQGDYTSANDASWTVHSGTYTVPVGQTTTRLTFTALNTVSGSLSSGNFIDNVELYVLPNCENSDGDSLDDYNDLDSDNDGIPDNVEAQSTAGYILPSGTVNVSGPYIGLWDNYGTGITPEDTDNDGTPDYLDSDSDNDGYTDIQENGMANGLLGTDTDSDGLDDNFEGGNLIDPLDVNDEIDNPSSSILPDSDFDLGTGGDLDYRDSNPPICTIGSDSDGDGINDVCDLDDDNDGIPDVNELGTIISTEQQPCGGDTPLDFSTPPTLLSGPDKLQGAVYRFPNISTGMDAIVTIVETNNATVVDVDRNVTTPASFKPRTGFNFTDSGEYGYIEYKFEFVNSGGFVPQVIPKFFMNFNDLDGGATFGETNWADNPKTYTIDDPTEITMSTDGTWVIATGATSDYGPSTNEFPFINFAVNYTNKSEISIRVGAIARVPGVSSSGRSHSIEFNCITNYVSPQTYSLDGDYDGLANHLDLDSDNDGILDAVESGHGQPHTNGVVNGPYGANGLADLVETAAGSNTLNYVITDTDGTDGSNFLDIDSDGDSCYDALEGSAAYGYTDVDIYSGQLIAAIDGNGVPGGTSQGIGTSANNLVQSLVCNSGATVDFDGIDDYLSTPEFLIGAQEVTAMAWIKIDPSNMGATDSKYILSNSGVFSITTATGNSINFSFKISTGFNTVGAFNVNYGEWHHVAVSFSGITGEVKMYSNGTTSGPVVTDYSGEVITSDINGNGNFDIGRRSILAPGNSYFPGEIDEVRVFNKALTDDQIQKIVYQEIQQNGLSLKGTFIDKDIDDSLTNDIVGWSDLIAYYPMTNILEGKCNDISANSRNLTLHNITTVQAQTAPMPYETVADGAWSTEGTWLHGDVWDIEDVANNKDWSIVHIKNDVTTNSSHTQLGMFIDAAKSLTVAGENEINNSWYLELNGTIDLADDSQLIQGLNSDLITSATGKILRRQEGNLNLFWYNYWSSPVGQQAVTNNTNTDFSIDMLKDGTQLVQFTTDFSPPDTSPVTISKEWLYKFQNGVTYYDWVNFDESTLIEPGIGYTQKGSSVLNGEKQYTFEGKPNNGQILISAVDTGGPGNVEDVSLTTYLVGNPYPSALDARQFIADNSSVIGGTLLLWEQWAGSSHYLADYEGGYGFINNLTTERAYQYPGIPIADQVQIQGIKKPTFYIPVGQGFFVEIENDGNIEFNNGQRVLVKESDALSDQEDPNYANNGSSFLRTSNSEESTSTAETVAETQILRLEFGVSSGASRSFVLGFTEDATDGYDYGLDGGLINDPPADDMGSLLNGQQYVIQAFAPYTPDKEIDLVLHASGNFTYTLKSTEISNFPAEQDLFIKDLLTGQSYDLRNTEPYNFSSVAGSFTERFKVVFQDPAALSTQEFATDSTLVFVNQPEDKLYVLQLTEQARELSISNMLGQRIKIFNSIDNQTLENGINISDLSSGIYIISIKTENNQSIDKKVIID